MENKFWNTDLGDLNEMARAEANAYDIQNLAAKAVEETLAGLGVQNMSAPVEPAPVAVEPVAMEEDPNYKVQAVIASYKMVIDELFKHMENDVLNCYAPKEEEFAPVLTR